MSVGDEEVRSVLARASEIQEGASLSHADVERLILAAEEVGISRAAVESALRERMSLPMQPPTVGQLTFARSTDEKYYVAEVVATDPAGVAVRFLRGGERTMQLDDLRPCSLLPGDRVVVDWPWWGAWTCTVVSYSASDRRVKVTDGWGETETFAISDVWIAPRLKSGSRRGRLTGALLTAATVGAALGTALGAVLF